MLKLDKLLDAYSTKELRVSMPSAAGVSYLLISEDTLLKVDEALTYVYYGEFKFKLGKDQYSVVV
jgi:hypothetical protein